MHTRVILLNAYMSDSLKCKHTCDPVKYIPVILLNAYTCDC